MPSGRLARLRPPVAAAALMAVGLALFLGLRWAAPAASPGERGFRPELMLVLPPPVAAALSGGDAHLAANLAVMRGMVVATHLDSPEQRALFARLMDSASRLNPAHADGYYLSQALLPWQGRVTLTQAIQERAARARPWDWLPPFFRAFNTYYFRQQPTRAAAQLRSAAERAPQGNRTSLEAMAARWGVLGSDPAEARRLLEGLLAGTRHEGLRRELRGRLEQLRGLQALREAAAAFRRRHHRPPREVTELVGHGGLEVLPRDPFGEGFAINDRGEVVVTPPKPLRNPRAVRP